VKKERTAWIDIARGIGILLVIYGHTLGSHGWRYLIYAFHMPLFFFLSGLVFRSRENETYPQSFKKDFKRLLIPYFIFALFSLILWFIILPRPEQTSSTIFKQILGIFYGNASNGYLAINTVLWFLPCLFAVRQIFWFLVKLKREYLLVALAIFSIIGYVISSNFSYIRLPFGIESALTGIVFFGAGYLWNYLPEKWNKIFNKYNIILAVIFIVFTIVFANLNYDGNKLQVDIRLNRYNNYYYFYIAAFAGILATIFFSKFLNKNRVLEYLGQKTMVLFIWHYLFFIYLSRFFFMLNPAESLIKLRNAYYPYIYTTLSIIFILLVDRIYLNFKSQLTTTKLDKYLKR
jgi:acyltransferase